MGSEREKTRASERTVINGDLVAASLQRSSVVALVQLAEVGQTGCSHPDLESLPVLEIRRRGLVGVAVGVPVLPVGRRDAVLWLVLGRAVKSPVAVPRDAGVVGHDVRDGEGVVARRRGRVEPHGVGKGVVEHRVGNQTAGVVGLLAILVAVQRRALGAGNGIVVASGALELIRIKRVDVAAMVLVEVGEMVVEENRCAHLLGDVESQAANIGADSSASLNLDADALVHLPLGINVGVDGLKVRRYVAIINLGEVCGSLVAAVRVVNAELLHFGAGVEQQTADGSKDDANCEEERQYRLRCQDGPAIWLAYYPMQSCRCPPRTWSCFISSSADFTRKAVLTAMPLISAVEKPCLESNVSHHLGFG